MIINIIEKILILIENRWGLQLKIENKTIHRLTEELKTVAEHERAIEHETFDSPRRSRIK